jgi:hypothetical protein
MLRKGPTLQVGFALRCGQQDEMREASDEILISDSCVIRFVAMILNGDIVLPNREEMEKVAAADEEEWNHRFSYDCTRVKGQSS